jgi:serine/threonine-protein kinase
MPGKVLLKVVRGKLRGKTYVFTGRTACLIGRAEDCHIRLPNDADHRFVSRHHCLLDVDPPHVYVQDFGSRNGTYLNGRRVRAAASPNAGTEGFPDHVLDHGDRLRVGSTEFRVQVLQPVPCAVCGAELLAAPRKPVSRGGQPHPHGRVCPACRRRRVPAPVPDPAARRCTGCGCELGGTAGAAGEPPSLCASCGGEGCPEIETLAGQDELARHDCVAIQGYRLIHELGRRRSSAVYLARHDETLDIVALKVMFPRCAGDRMVRMRFLREAQNLMVLRHPNVVELRDAGWSSGAFYFTLEYCAGGTVARLLKERGGLLPLAEAGPLVLQALDALEYCHNILVPFVPHEGGEWSPGQGLVHRDVKPSNLYLTGPPGRPVVKIGDFGLAKAFGKAGSSGITTIGKLSGTPFFMPRQQVLAYKSARPEVDVWAAAATLYFMLTGQPPRDFSGGQSWLEVVLETSAVPIRRRLASVPARVADVIDLALVDRPEILFKTAAEFKNALLDAL